MIKLLTYHDIDQQQWQQLIECSPYATWFQTDEAYRFYQSVGDMQAFAYGVSEDDNFVGLVVGYITIEKCKFKQHFAARAIIVGGPLLADNISNEALTALLKAVRAMESNGQSPIANRPIELIELKGFNRDQVNALMYNCDTLLMTSKTEGSPQVIKEAMACGCPIVSVDVGDVAERVSGVEGCYVVSSREPAAIAKALQQALAFSGKTNGRERILEMKLSNEQVAERLMAIYKQLV